MTFAALFLFLYSIALTLSPAVRLHSWNVSYRWTHWIGFVTWLVGYSLLHRQIMRRAPDRDPYILPIVSLLTGLGMLTIWRLDLVFGIRQTIWLGVGVSVIWVLLRRPGLVNLIRRYKYLLLVSGLILTALTFFFGTYPGGTGPRLWLGCCGVYIQPSEPLKLFLIIYLAAYLADRLPVTPDFGELLAPTLVMAGAAVLLLLAQRDLGTTTLVVAIYTAIVYLASGKRSILWIAIILVVGMGLAGYQMFDVIRLRVDAWLNPWVDPSGRSYQIVQSLLAFASGAIFGSGPGMGSPGVVPVAHSDFIAAAIAEEMGLLGVAALVLAFALLTVRGFLAAFRASSNYNRFLAAGVTTYLALQCILIISGNIRLLPLTGVTLPFVSYGGSSLLTSMLSVGILLVVSNRGEEEPIPLPNRRPYVVTGSLILVGLFSLSVVAGWWGFGRAGELQTRPDNPRRTINDRYVPRGPIFDRQNRPLVLTEGERGGYTRRYIYPLLGNIIGYTHPTYGQAGLESSLDGYLRGTDGNPASLIWSTQILYSQPPAGLPVRLSIDLDLQQSLDLAMDDQVGAAVLLNASTGEILAITSRPTFDPNQLDEQWPSLVAAADAPLLNRTTQGQYPIGGAIGPFALAKVLSQTSSLPALPDRLSYRLDTQQLDCALPVTTSGWEEAIRYGCPGALVAVSRSLSNTQFQDIHRQLGFYSVPDIPLPSSQAGSSQAIASVAKAALGQTNLQVTPLQMALAAASLSNHGLRPAPRLATSVRTPNQGWVVFPSSSTVRALAENGVEKALRVLADPNLPIWNTVASVPVKDGAINWYIGGSQPTWQGSPIALALVLEKSSAEAAYQIGNTILKDALQP